MKSLKTVAQITKFSGFSKRFVVQIIRTIDRFAYQHNKIPELIMSFIYAYVQLTSKVKEKNECKLFTQFCTKEFIDVRCIDHCVDLVRN
ncbi:hypothetical protein GLOIN_2v1879215 [Rhizophagus clarus]|uniref:Uncharacterized protein n=1 Tax=Rhizophagus clarus TaxID=94130 RepID=A0A8H3R2S0_9GLOM|nr:hypothetical protein GLOIN_2v1879215 [Rhizophagus clarus]